MSECEECGKETSHLICEQCFEDYKTIREETSRALVYEYKLRVEAEKERTCKWRKTNQKSPVSDAMIELYSTCNGEVVFKDFMLKDNPYCPRCGGKIELGEAGR